LLRVTERTKTREKKEEDREEKVKEKKEKKKIGKEKSLSQRGSFDTRLSCPSNAKVHLKKSNISSMLCPLYIFFHQSHLETIRLFISMTSKSIWDSFNKFSLLLLLLLLFLLLFSVDHNFCMPW
jgi:hypothetical protein